MKIAFIGLGNMGTGIAQCILKSGHDLIVWNRTATKTDPLVTLGARAATTAREAAAAADVVITSLMDDKSVLDVVRPDAVHACVHNDLAGMRGRTGKSAGWRRRVGRHAASRHTSSAPGGRTKVADRNRADAPAAIPLFGEDVALTDQLDG